MTRSTITAAVSANTQAALDGLTKLQTLNELGWKLPSDFETCPVGTMAELEQLRADAARYRWLKRGNKNGGPIVYCRVEYYKPPFTIIRADGNVVVQGEFKDIDAAIDAAMKGGAV